MLCQWLRRSYLSAGLEGLARHAVGGIARCCRLLRLSRNESWVADADKAREVYLLLAVCIALM